LKWIILFLVHIWLFEILLQLLSSYFPHKIYIFKCIHFRYNFNRLKNVNTRNEVVMVKNVHFTELISEIHSALPVSGVVIHTDINWNDGNQYPDRGALLFKPIYFVEKLLFYLYSFYGTSPLIHNTIYNNDLNNQT